MDSFLISIPFDSQCVLWCRRIIDIFDSLLLLSLSLALSSKLPIGKLLE